MNIGCVTMAMHFVVNVEQPAKVILANHGVTVRGWYQALPNTLRGIQFQVNKEDQSQQRHLNKWTHHNGCIPFSTCIIVLRKSLECSHVVVKLFYRD